MLAEKVKTIKSLWGHYHDLYLRPINQSKIIYITKLYIQKKITKNIFNDILQRCFLNLFWSKQKNTLKLIAKQRIH